MSFGGIKGMQLGQFIALSLAVHNIPEGLAVGLVLTTRKVSKVRAGKFKKTEVIVRCVSSECTVGHGLFVSPLC